MSINNSKRVKNLKYLQIKKKKIKKNDNTNI